MNDKPPGAKSTKKQWYAATLIIRHRIEDHNEPYQCDEEVRLIHARTPDKAYTKAYKLGKAQETCILNDAGEMVYVEFVGLADLCLIDSPLNDGAKIKTRKFVHSAPHIFALMKEELSLFKTAKGDWRIQGEAQATPINMEAL